MVTILSTTFSNELYENMFQVAPKCDPDGPNERTSDCWLRWWLGTEQATRSYLQLATPIYIDPYMFHQAAMSYE